MQPPSSLQRKSNGALKVLLALPTFEKRVEIVLVANLGLPEFQQTLKMN